MTDLRETPNRPVVGVGAVIVKGDKIVLIQRRKPPKQGDWSLPGGGVELGETTKQAVTREIREETGLRVTIGSLLDAVDYIETDDKGVRFHYVLIDYLASYKSGNLKSGSDAADARWFSFGQALALPLWSETKRVIIAAQTIAHQQKE